MKSCWAKARVPRFGSFVAFYGPNGDQDADRSGAPQVMNLGASRLPESPSEMNERLTLKPKSTGKRPTKKVNLLAT